MFGLGFACADRLIRLCASVFNLILNLIIIFYSQLIYSVLSMTIFMMSSFKLIKDSHLHILYYDLKS